MMTSEEKQEDKSYGKHYFFSLKMIVMCCGWRGDIPFILHFSIVPLDSLLREQIGVYLTEREN